MFTSRAEYRTLLRQDNADLRLTEKSFRLGLASQERMEKVLAKQNAVAEIKKALQQFSVEPEEINPHFQSIGSAELSEKQKASKLVLRPNVGLSDLTNTIPRLQETLSAFEADHLEQAEVQVKYERYIEKEQEIATRMQPESFDYHKVAALSNEALQKFNKIRPRTLGQASRISGVNPSDVQILMVYMGR